MQAVGELDQDDPDVLGHRQEHLADVLGLLLLVAVRAELGQLRDAIDELRDLGPEPLLDVGQAVLGVLGDVVEQRGLDRDRVDPELGEDLGRRDRVRDVRLAGRAPLAVMRRDGEIERATRLASRSTPGCSSRIARAKGRAEAFRGPGSAALAAAVGVEPPVPSRRGARGGARAAGFARRGDGGCFVRGVVAGHGPQG